MTKIILLRRESRDFRDVLKDPILDRISSSLFHKYLMLIFEPFNDSHEADITYVTLKYGEDLVGITTVIKDRTPVPNYDYIPSPKT